MSGILAVVSEYNPLHNGHLLHFNRSKQITKADFSIAVITGNFVQRGDIELPTLYAISSAENFADGAIKILNSLGIVDYLSFGSELGEIAPLDDLASILGLFRVNAPVLVRVASLAVIFTSSVATFACVAAQAAVLCQYV